MCSIVMCSTRAPLDALRDADYSRILMFNVFECSSMFKFQRQHNFVHWHYHIMVFHMWLHLMGEMQRGL